MVRKARDEAPTQPTSKRGRKPGRKSNPAEQAARQTNAVSHGKNVKGGQLLSAAACRAATCPHPDGSPCPTKATTPSLSLCTPQLLGLDPDQPLTPQLAAQFKTAFETGDGKALTSINAGFLGGLGGMLANGLQEIEHNGGVTVHRVLREENADGDLETRVVGIEEHPAVRTVLGVADRLGINANEQLVTPKSRGRAQNEDAATDALKGTAERLGRLDAVLGGA